MVTNEDETSKLGERPYLMIKFTEINEKCERVPYFFSIFIIGDTERNGLSNIGMGQ